MNDGLKVAALVPVYNERETIVPVLERLLPVCEGILVVDDGSRDGSAGGGSAGRCSPLRRPAPASRSRSCS